MNKDNLKMWLIIIIVICWGIVLQLTVGNEHPFIINGTFLLGVWLGSELRLAIIEKRLNKETKK